MSLLRVNFLPRSLASPALRRLIETLGWFARAVGLAALALGLYLGALLLSDNIHEVEPHILYRSAQLDAEALRAVTQRYGIRAVLSLRGGGKGDAWYDEQARATRGLGLVWYQFPLSDRRDVKPARLDEILQTMRRAPKPLLIHCKAGADRAGLVAAAYLLSNGRDLDIADDQLSLRYGHFPYLWSNSVAMDRSLSAFAQHLQSAPAVTGLELRRP